MNNNLIVLKLGGSILTYKDKRPLFRYRTVSRLITEIKKAKADLEFKLIIVHGTGSFGHPVANEYNLKDGLNNPVSSIWGFSKSKRQGFLLNAMFWKVLEESEIPAVTIQSSALIKSTDGVISKFDTKIIQECLDKDLVVTLFGDEVFDTKTGFSVCSSDQIATYLASKLNPRCLLFASDVDGVYDYNPKVSKNAKRYASFKISTLSNFESKFVQHNAEDVSGEMFGKLKAFKLFKISPRVRMRIFNGLKHNQLLKALKGGSVGTEIVA